MPSAGQREAFDRLFLAEYTRVTGIANRVLADPAEAEDVAQEVFIRFTGSTRRWPISRRPGCIAPRHMPPSTGSGISGARRASAGYEPATALDPALAAEASYQRGMVREAMRRIPEKQAAVLALRYSGLSYAEVAQALGVGIGQVGTLLRRAEARLRQEVTR